MGEDFQVATHVVRSQKSFRSVLAPRRIARCCGGCLSNLRPLCEVGEKCQAKKRVVDERRAKRCFAASGGAWFRSLASLVVSALEPSFAQLRIAAFESRRADDVARMIERFGGVAHVSPSLREAPVERNPAAVDFALRLLTGQVDVLILLTGVGVKYFLEQVAPHCDRQRLLDALRDIPLVVRGPKPLAVLRELGVKPAHIVPEPNTWREILALLDAELPVANAQVAVLEYGVPNVSLIAGL